MGVCGGGVGVEGVSLSLSMTIGLWINLSGSEGGVVIGKGVEGAGA